MGKGFKLLRSSLIRSLQFCRSTSPTASALPPTPAPVLSTIDHKVPGVPDPPLSTPCRPLRRRRVKAVPTACGCRRGSGASSETSYDCDTESLEYSWEKDGKWHVISRLHDDGPRQKICLSGDTSPVQPPNRAKEKKVIRKKKKKGAAAPSARTSTSSGDSGWFSSESGDYDDEETETLLSSSRSFSNEESFEMTHQLETIIEESKSVGKTRRLKCRTCRSSSRDRNPKLTTSSPVRVSALQGRIPCRILGGKVRESFAVVKKSRDPYSDFKESMAEMITERRMFEAEELEQLLLCFLSLNSPEHHGIIVEAFSAVWEDLSANANHRQCLNVFRGADCEQEGLI